MKYYQPSRAHHGNPRMPLRKRHYCEATIRRSISESSLLPEIFFFFFFSCQLAKNRHWIIWNRSDLRLLELFHKLCHSCCQQPQPGERCGDGHRFECGRSRRQAPGGPRNGPPHSSGGGHSRCTPDRRHVYVPGNNYRMSAWIAIAHV